MHNIHFVIFGVVLLILSLSGCDNAGECAVCRDEKCSDLVALCAVDTDCACMSDCMGEKGFPVDGCLASCGLAIRPQAFHAVEECVARACPDSDECNSGGSYTPPGADVVSDGADADISGGDLPDCGFDPMLAFDAGGSVLQLESADKQVCVRLQRRSEGSGSLANTEYRIESVRLGPLGGVAEITDAGAMCYYSSHHNFQDWVHVWTGQVHYDVKLQLDPGVGRSYTLHTGALGPLEPDVCAPTASATEPLGAPVELFPVNP